MSMLPWDYNLAFSTYSLGMPDPVNDAELYVNYPIDTPASGEVMLKRPMYHELMKNDTYFETYHRYMDRLISGYFESGYFEDMLDEVSSMIRGYVKRDTTAFCSYEDHLKAVDTIRDFCLLRAESVRGQLNGEIGSTIAEQSKDRSSFVDASAVWLPIWESFRTFPIKEGAGSSLDIYGWLCASSFGQLISTSPSII